MHFGYLLIYQRILSFLDSEAEEGLHKCLRDVPITDEAKRTYVSLHMSIEQQIFY